MLCDIAQALKSFIAELLEREEALKRNIREETVSDMWAASLIGLRKFGVKVDLSIESETGGDLEVWFLSHDISRGVGFVIQSKRVHCRREAPRPSDCLTSTWEMHAARELDHAAGDRRPKGSQACDLITARRRTRRDLYPLYAIYSPKHVCDESGGEIEGVMLADGFDMARHIWRSRKNKVWGWKQLRLIKQMLFRVDALFCAESAKILGAFDAWNRLASQRILLFLAADTVTLLTIPSPEKVRDRMAEAIRSKRGRERGFLPQVTERIPWDIRQLASTGELPAHDKPHRGRSMIAFVATLSEAEYEELP